MRVQKIASFAAVISLIATASAPALTSQFAALMDGPSEQPPNASPGTGSALLKYDSAAHTLRIEADFSGLLGTTTAAHIHAPTAQGNQGVVGVAVTPGTLPGFPAGVTSGTYDFTVDLTNPASYTTTFLNNFGGGTAGGAEDALIQFLNEERAYFNVHTTAFPGGEIRGFLRPSSVPEGGITLGLFTLGCLGLAAFRRLNS